MNGDDVLAAVCPQAADLRCLSRVTQTLSEASRHFKRNRDELKILFANQLVLTNTPPGQPQPSWTRWSDLPRSA